MKEQKSKRQQGKTNTPHFYELKELKNIGTKHLQTILVSNLENTKHVFFPRPGLDTGSDTLLALRACASDKIMAHPNPSRRGVKAKVTPLS